MSDLKRKNASTLGSRKKRMPTKVVHELPDSLFNAPKSPSTKTTGLQRRHKKNQGGARLGTTRRTDKPRQPAQASSSSTSEGVTSNVVEAVWLDAVADDLIGANQGGDAEHVADNDHGTPSGASAKGAKDVELSDSDGDSDVEWEDDEIEYEAYSEAVRTNVAVFLPVCGNIFVVQGWDTSRNRATKSFFHLKFQTLGTGDLSVACTCRAAAFGACFHIRYFNQHGLEEKALGDIDADAVLFSQKIVPGVGLDSLFSVQSNSVVELRGRAFVNHQGPARDSGPWKCSKDRGSTSCYHINQAKTILPQDFGPEIAQAMKVAGSVTVIKGTNVRADARGPGQTISYLPVRPPHWAKLDSDPVLYASLPEFRVPPPRTVFKLEKGESTCADESRTEFDPSRPTEIKECKFYTILNVYRVKIELQPCPSCPRERKRFIGPDLRKHGVFNYNNKVLVAHELLDEYTSAYTSSEKPCWSFAQDVNRRYKRECSSFMGPDLFRSVWFSYVHLQRFTDDMTCSSCGPNPKTVIFDGITLGYGHKHVKDSLEPPTRLSEHSLVRSGLDYTRQQQLLPDALLRRRLRSAMEGPDFAPLIEDLEERLGAISLSPLKSSGDATPSTPADPLSTPALTRSLVEYATQSDNPPSASAPPTPTKAVRSVTSPFPEASFAQPNFKFGVSGAVLPFTFTVPGTTNPPGDDPFAVSSPNLPSTVNSFNASQLGPSTAARDSASKATSPSKGTSQGKRGLTDAEWKARQKSLVREHLASIEWVRLELLKQGGPDCPELSALFDRYFGQVSYASKGKHSKAVLALWKNFFMQIAAEESVLQMINYNSWTQLKGYLANPTVANGSNLVSIPAFYKAISSRDCDVPALNSVMRWIEKKARDVLVTLIRKASPPIPLADPATLSKEDDWRKTGCYYSMPAIRHRPVYPKLDDTEKKNAKAAPRGDRCGKYYSEYKEKRLTGGIMVCWCKHSVCYGFHTIPESEGRNDVFSALVTRWPLAPERVVYDFACALGPYCMTREPQFFGNTYFMIDHFHAEGHTKCSPAAFLSEYENTDPQLSSVNSSAAECGNGALRKIRKSVSYMSQERAIIYTKVFLSIWNRTRALENARKRGKKSKRPRKK